MSQWGSLRVVELNCCPTIPQYIIHVTLQVRLSYDSPIDEPTIEKPLDVTANVVHLLHCVLDKDLHRSDQPKSAYIMHELSQGFHQWEVPQVYHHPTILWTGEGFQASERRLEKIKDVEPLSFTDHPSPQSTNLPRA